MRSARLFFLLLFAIHAMVRTAYCDLQTSTSYAFSLVASDSGEPNMGIPSVYKQDGDSDFLQSPQGGHLTSMSGFITAPARDNEASVSAEARASIDSLGVSFQGVAIVSAPGFAEYNVGSVQATWFDSTVITAPGFNPLHPLIIDVPLIVHGSLSINPGAKGGGAAKFRLRDFDANHPSLPPAPIPSGFPLSLGPDLWGYVQKDSTHSADIDLQPPTVIPSSRVCNTGLTCTVGYVMEVLGYGRTSPNGFEVTDASFSNTLTWGGITSVRDALTGEPVEDWTITSESGFDYSKSYEQQVPEPSSLGLIVALIGTPLARRRRHRGGRG
jgi:hypothetical protein